MADNTTPPTSPVKPIDQNRLIQSTPQEQLPAEPLSKPPPPEPKTETPHDLFRPLNEDLQSLAEHQLRSPEQRGPKVPIDRPLSREMMERPPVDPRPLLSDPIFRNPHMRDTPLYRHLQARTFLTQSSLSQPRHNLREERQNLKMILAARVLPWEGENKKIYREFLRQEIRELRHPPEEALSEEGRFQPFFKDARGLMNRLSEAVNSFEKILKEMFSGQEVVSSPPEGKTAQFRAKGLAEWGTFYSNMMTLGNAETPITRSMSELAEALFRGLYQQTLVSDLNFLEGEKMVADKFARILINNPDLLEALQKLSPGDKLSPELLAKLGAQLSYLQLTHIPQVASAAAREAARDAALAQLRNPANIGAMALLEKALKQEREERDLRKNFPSGILPYFMAGKSEWEKESRWGKGKFWVYFGYSVATVMAGLLGYVIFRGLF